MPINNVTQPNMIQNWLQNNNTNNVQIKTTSTNTQATKDELQQDTLQKNEPKKSFTDKLKNFFTSKIGIITSIVAGLCLLTVTFIAIKNKKANDKDFNKIVNEMTNDLNRLLNE